MWIFVAVSLLLEVGTTAVLKVTRLKAVAIQYSVEFVFDTSLLRK